MAAEEPPEDGFEIDDPEELSQKKRVRDILNRRNEVIDARNRAMDERLLGEASHEESLAHYQSRIESLIIDLFTKFEAYESDEVDGDYYLYDTEIDTITINPPPEVMPSSTSDLASGAEPPEPKTVTIKGLNWFIENEPIVTESFSVQQWNPPQVHTASNRRLIPFKTLDKAFIKCIKFIGDIGIDAKIEEQEQHTKIDRDLLEEVDEWRQNNVNND